MFVGWLWSVDLLFFIPWIYRHNITTQNSHSPCTMKVGMCRILSRLAFSSRNPSRGKNTWSTKNEWFKPDREDATFILHVTETTALRCLLSAMKFKVLTCHDISTTSYLNTPQQKSSRKPNTNNIVLLYLVGEVVVLDSGKGQWELVRAELSFHYLPRVLHLRKR